MQPIVPIEFRRSAECNFTDTDEFCAEYQRAPLQSRRVVADMIPLDVIRDVWQDELRQIYLHNIEAPATAKTVLLAAGCTRIRDSSYWYELPEVGKVQSATRVAWLKGSPDLRQEAFPLMASQYLTHSATHDSVPKDAADYRGRLLTELWSRQLYESLITSVCFRSKFRFRNQSKSDERPEWDGFGSLVKKAAYVCMADTMRPRLAMTGIPEAYMLSRVLREVSWTMEASVDGRRDRSEIINWLRSLPAGRDTNAIKRLYVNSISYQYVPKRIRHWAYLPMRPHFKGLKLAYSHAVARAEIGGGRDGAVEHVIADSGRMGAHDTYIDRVKV